VVIRKPHSAAATYRVAPDYAYAIVRKTRELPHLYQRLANERAGNCAYTLQNPTGADLLNQQTGIKFVDRNFSVDTDRTDVDNVF